MDRFFRSASLAKIDIGNLKITRQHGAKAIANGNGNGDGNGTACLESKKRELLELGKELVAFSGVREGELRYWLSTGKSDGTHTHMHVLYQLNKFLISKEEDVVHYFTCTCCHVMLRRNTNNNRCGRF